MATMTPAQIIEKINEWITTNGQKEITGAHLNTLLNSVMEYVGVGYALRGTAPASAPSPDVPSAYLAAPGTYTNYESGDTVIPEGSIAVLKYDGSAWSKSVIKVCDPVSVSQNTLIIGSEEVGELAGQLIDNSEWAEVTLDADGYILKGIRKDGTIYELMPSNQDEETREEFNSKLQTKVDKVLNKSLINKDYADGISYIDNPEWADVELDKDGYIIQGVRKDGTIYPKSSVTSQTIINNTYNNTFETNTQNNTYDVTATPQITTDTNNYLASTNDDTDRTMDIATLLQSTGYVKLGPGKFVVDNLQMPDLSCIEGCGNKTRIVLKSGVSGYAIKLGNCCTISNCRILGIDSTDNVNLSLLTISSTLGDRHGVVFEGNYDTQTSDTKFICKIDSVDMAYFDGGGITCRNTGYGTLRCISVSNTNIWDCNAGINISYWSEFHRFINVNSQYCWYGCVNNGGNNVFTNCSFTHNVIGFFMDNSMGQSPNNSHGTCVGCTFHHEQSSGGVANEGHSIKILNNDNAFIFVGCQIAFGKIYIEDSDGIEFSAVRMGNCDVSINGGKLIMFIGCMISDSFTKTVINNDYTHFISCYSIDGNQIQ